MDADFGPDGERFAPTELARGPWSPLHQHGGAPSALLAFVAVGWLKQPRLTPLFLLAWCALAFAISYLLFIPVRRLVANRCETLAQYY